MKKLVKFIMLVSVPFLLVWIAYFLTAFSFNPQDIFHSSDFYGIVVVYWFVIICFLGPIVEFI
jgi:hypothetical protein